MILSTTDQHKILTPLLDRMKCVFYFDYYSEEELEQIVEKRCKALGWNFEKEILPEIGKRSRGTPRWALRFLQSSRRVARSMNESIIKLSHLQKSLELDGIDSLGLTRNDVKYVNLLKDGPLRLNVLGSMLGLDSKTVSTTIEPFILRIGLIAKDEQGRRVLTEKGHTHLQNK